MEGEPLHDGSAQPEAEGLFRLTLEVARAGPESQRADAVDAMDDIRVDYATSFLAADTAGLVSASSPPRATVRLGP